jgi:hypothetical protein
MAVATVFSKASKDRVWALILRSMGYNCVGDMIKTIHLTDGGDPVAEDVAIDDYCFIWDPTNNTAWFHTTGTTFVQVGNDLTADRGMLNNKGTLGHPGS